MGLFNVIWFVFFGWTSALIIIIFSVIMAITIIGYPIAKSLFEFAKLSAFPFGKEVIRETELKGKINVSSLVRMAGFILRPVGAKVVTNKQAVASSVANEMEKREDLKQRRENKTKAIDKIEEAETKKIDKETDL